MTTETRTIKEKLSDLEMSHYDLTDKNDSMKVFVDDKTKEKVSIYVTIKGLEVKYLPLKYDKVVFVPDSDTTTYLEQMHEHIVDQLKEDNTDQKVACFVKGETFSVKAPRDIKEEINKALKPGDVIDLVVTYNGVSLYEDTWYPVFIAHQFRRVKNTKKKVVVNQFAD
jgi:hypothetical protein